MSSPTVNDVEYEYFSDSEAENSEFEVVYETVSEVRFAFAILPPQFVCTVFTKIFAVGHRVRKGERRWGVRVCVLSYLRIQTNVS